LGEDQERAKCRRLEAMGGNGVAELLDADFSFDALQEKVTKGSSTLKHSRPKGKAWFLSTYSGRNRLVMDGFRDVGIPYLDRVDC
jgi:hypothetical protein